MRDGRRRLIGRLFYWALVGITAIGFRLSAFAAELAGGRCNYYRCGHCVSGGWQRGFRDADHFLACVCNGGRECGRSRIDECCAGSERGAERVIGAEFGSHSGGRVLQRGLSARARAGENGVLDCANDISGEAFGSTEHAGGRIGGAAGIAAVCEFGTGNEGGRYVGRTPERRGNDQREQDVR